MRLELITLRNKKDNPEFNSQEKKSVSGFNKAPGKRERTSKALCIY